MTRATNDLQIIQEYIAGRMSDADLRDFETQLSNDATLVQDIEESLRLREGLQMLREQGVSLAHPNDQRRDIRRWLVRAAAAALAVIVLSLGFRYFERSPALVAASVAELGASTGTPLIIVARHSFAAVREASETPDLQLPASGALELRALTPGTGDTHGFRLTLEKIREGRGSSAIGVMEHLTPDADGFVAIYVDASRVEPGDYLLIVAPDVGDESTAERFPFRLKRAAGTTGSR